MAGKHKIRGLETVMRNLNTRIESVKGRTLKGIVRGVALIRRDMDKTSPLIPVDIGNLRASFFVITSNGSITSGATPTFRTTGKKNTLSASELMQLQMIHSNTIAEMTAKAQELGATKGPFVVFGFGAYYALYVHEMIDAQNWTRPGSGVKFLENAVDRNTALVLYTVAKEAKGALK